MWPTVSAAVSLFQCDGEDRDKNAAFLEGPKGKIFRGFRSDIPGFEDAVAAWPYEDGLLFAVADGEFGYIDDRDNAAIRPNVALAQRT